MFKPLPGLVFTTSTFLSINTVVSAQTPPPQLPPRVPPPPPRPNDSIQVPEPAPPLIDGPTLPAPSFSPPSPAIETTIFVDGFTFMGNTVFSDEQLLEVAQPYLQRNLEFSELIRLRSQITDLYIENGYTTSGAFIPIAGNETIDIRSATVAIQIIEGTVEGIEFSGDERLVRYVSARLDSAIAPVLNQSKLEESLRLLQLDPLVESISANLSAGTQVGSSLLSVAVASPPTFQASIRTDNHRTPSAGSIQGETQLEASNLLAMGERLSTSYSATEGSDTFSVGFDLPINARNGTLSFEYAQLNGRIVERPLADFDIETESRVYGVSLRQPLIRTASDATLESFVIGLAANRIESETTLAGFPFPLSPGANEDGKTQITEISLLQDYTRQNQNSALLVRSQFDIGLDAFNATRGAEPDGQYFLWRGQALWLQKAWGQSQWFIRGDVQLSGDQLVPLSQFSLGGPTSVRGYRQDAIIADNGLALTAELDIPLLEDGQAQQLSLIPFAGTGVGWNNGAARALENDFLGSVGIGMQYEWDALTARVNYAIPFTETDATGDSLQEDGLDFSLGYQLRF
ncbi:MAG: ShlB/FhaC/HecB family hemolysin secretion/activation protein [Cyanobacteria bacterium J06555_13]